MTDMIGGEGDQSSGGLTRGAWIKILVLAGLFIALNFWQIDYLLTKWKQDSNWSHGFLIPLFSLYLLYSHRHELFSAERRPCVWGLVTMILGIILTPFALVNIGTNWACNLAMVMSLFGLVWYLCGTKVMRVAWVPVLYLVLAMPFPERLYQNIALPLQNFAAMMSTIMLQLFGVDISVNASQLDIVSISGAHHPLTVAEACSGVRSLMAFISLSVAMAYIDDRPLWQRLVLIFSGVPIAIACNVLRVALTGMMFVLDRPDLGQDFMHEFMGMALLIPALLLLLLLSKLMNSVYLDEEYEDDQDDSPPQVVVESGKQTPAAGAGGIGALIVRERHFVVAAVVLLAATLSWSAMKTALEIVTQRKPTPWPAVVQVDNEFRLVGLPTTHGPFVRIEDGEFFKDPNTGEAILDGEPDGEPTFDEEERKLLGLQCDEQLRISRRSAWYIARYYRDTRPGRDGRIWVLHVYYYTGGVDRVPHVSEVCLQAAGASIDSRNKVSFDIPGLRRPWDQGVDCNRILYQRAANAGYTYADYYTFAYNGEPTADFMYIRRQMAKPWAQYSYFAKIQFSLQKSIISADESDKAAEEFLSYVLPDVLKMFPSIEDMKKLDNKKSTDAE